MDVLQTALYRNCFAQGQTRTYRVEEILIRPDDPPRGVFFITDGYVRIYSLTRSGEEKLHTIYKPGNVFPLMWALHDITKDLFYEALSPLSVRMMEKSAFLRRIRTDATLLYEVTILLTEILDEFADRVSNLEITHAYPRVIERLLFLARRFGTESDGSVVVDLPITHKDIAASIAMTRETASREMEILEKKRLISYQPHSITIPDRKKLQQELDEHYERKTL